MAMHTIARLLGAVCAVAVASAWFASASRALDYEERRLLEGVVKLDVVRLGGVPDVGAGVVVGVDGGTAYVLTALHVLVGPESERNVSGWERRPDEIRVQVEFHGDPTPLDATILGRWNEELDLAVVVVNDPRVSARGTAVAYGVGSPGTLATPYPAIAIGHGGRKDWAHQATRVQAVSAPWVRLLGEGIGPGYSGGALIDTTRNLLIGMVTGVSIAGADAVAIDEVVANLDAWRVPHHLRRARLSAPMVRVPPGPFVIRVRSGAMEERREVYLDAYFIDKYEVTVRDFRRFIEDTGYRYRPGLPTCNFAREERDGYPMNCVSWADAAAFAEWARKSLPTEAQWEKAARGPRPNAYPWGEAPVRPGDAAVQLDWPVGVGAHERDRSPYGAMDMLGNVSEWVADWYRRDRAQYLEPRNPEGPPSGQDRVIRGASYDTPPARANLMLRRRNLQEYGRKSLDYGFRCVINEISE